MKTLFSARVVSFVTMILFLHTIAFAEPISPQIDEGADAKQALETLNGIIGEWRGTAQPRRGSSQGAWRQTGELVWDFTQPEPAIRYLVKDGKLVQSGRFTWNAMRQKFELHVVTPEETTLDYSGHWEQNRLVFTSEKNSTGIKHRITVTPLSLKRLLVLHERTTASGQAFHRVAEVGYTRAGTHLAVSGQSRRECVVTGGAGTSSVTYQGKTYYVCCSGCRQAFLEDPESILADFAARLKKRQAGQKDQ